MGGGDGEARGRGDDKIWGEDRGKGVHDRKGDFKTVFPLKSPSP